MSAVLSYHGDPAIKAAHIAQAKHHADADMLRSGTFGEIDAGSFKGCSVGCFAYEIDPKRSDYHTVLADAAGWPEWLVYLSDSMFEGLLAGDRERFHVELRERVPVGFDLTPVLHKIAVARMNRMLLDKNVQCNASVVAAITTVRDLHLACSIAHSAAQSAAYSARLAAQLAAQSAEYSARLAAQSAAHSARLAARLAAQSVAHSARLAAQLAAQLAAYSAAWIDERDALYEAIASVGGAA